MTCHGGIDGSYTVTAHAYRYVSHRSLSAPSGLRKLRPIHKRRDGLRLFSVTMAHLVGSPKPTRVYRLEYGQLADCCPPKLHGMVYRGLSMWLWPCLGYGAYDKS